MRAAAATVTNDRTVRIRSVLVGSRRAVLIAGPCAVEPDYVETARMVAALGVDVLRGSTFKPRTRPESFQGLGRAGLELVAEARVRTGVPVVTEVLAVETSHWWRPSPTVCTHTPSAFGLLQRAEMT